MKIKLFFALCLVFSLILPIFSFAQTANEDEIVTGVEYPALAINTFRMKEYQFTPGTKISAELNIENVLRTVADYKYKVRMLPVDKKLLATTSAQVVLSSSQFSKKATINPGEKQEIQIDYDVPTFINSDAMLEVVFYNDAGVLIGRKSLFLLNTKKVTSANSTSSSTVKEVNKSVQGVIEIKKIRFIQGDVSFEPKGEGSAYLLKKNADLKIIVETEGTNEEDPLIQVKISNVYSSSSSFDTVYQSIDTKLLKSNVELVIKGDSLKTGVYSVEITPISRHKKEVGPARVVTIGVEGLTAIIQAFEVKGNLPIKRGDTLTLLADWVPIAQISKSLTEDLSDDAELNTPFFARLLLTNQNGDIVSSSTLTDISSELKADIVAQQDASSLNGRLEIWSGDTLLASYDRSILVPPPKGESNTSKILGTIFLVLLLIGFAVYLVTRFIKNKSLGNFTGVKLFAFILIIATAIPSFSFAAWTQLGTTLSFDHLFPQFTDTSSTTWSTNSGVTAFSRSCTKRTHTVTYTNPLISGNNRAYRGEYKWHAVRSSGLTWYWVEQGLDPEVWPVVYPVGPYVKSAFIHEKVLDRNAWLYDDFHYTDVLTSSPNWMDYRPLRLRSPNTEINTRLATTTYANLNAWLQLRYTAFRDSWYPIMDNGDSQFSALFEIVPGAMSAWPAENLFGWDANYSQKMVELGFSETQDLLYDFDAGAFLNDVRSQGAHLVGDPSGRYDYDTDIPLSWQNAEDLRSKGEASRPGTYRLFNFLYTVRDETNLTYGSGSIWDCVSSNMKVFQDTYEVVANSQISIVMFYDEDGDGVRDAGEKSIAYAMALTEQQSNIDGGNVVMDYGSTTGMYSVCRVPPSMAAYSTSIPDYYIEEGNEIATLYPRYTNSVYKGAVAFVKSADQVLLPSYILDDSYYYLYNPENTLYYWAQISGVGGSAIDGYEFDSQGRMIIKTLYSVCGHTVNEDVPSAGHFEEYQDQVINYPAPSTVANDYTAYWKIPVNAELSSQYTVGTDATLLPTGWVATTPDQTINVTTGNSNHVVELGIKYSASGVCGSATTTLSGPAYVPSTNLCSSGQSTAPASEDQRYTWTCLGAGGGSDSSCVKQKCPTSNPYYCSVTDSCVATMDECIVSGVCGYADVEEGQSNAGNPPYPPENFLCDAGTESPVAGEGLPFAYHTWSCFGTNGGTTASCDRPKCSNGLVYCSMLNECRLECPVTSTSTLIFDASLSPRVVRTAADQCIFSWKTSSSEDLPVSCELDGVSLGGASATIQRSAPVSVGSHTLSCTNTEQDQSTTTRCLLNPSFKEI